MRKLRLQQPRVETVARIFGCTPNQARAQYRRYRYERRRYYLDVEGYGHSRGLYPANAFPDGIGDYGQVEAPDAASAIQQIMDSADRIVSIWVRQVRAHGRTKTVWWRNGNLPPHHKVGGTYE